MKRKKLYTVASGTSATVLVSGASATYSATLPEALEGNVKETLNSLLELI